MRYLPKSRRVLSLWVVLAIALLAGSAGAAADEKKPPSFEEKVEGLERRAGLLTLWVDKGKGKVWLELPAAEDSGEIGRYLHVEGLVAGLGSNPVGLDRGQLGPTRLVRFRRLGGKVLLEQLNTGFRAQSEDPRERRAVAESFATSVLWAGEVAAEADDGRLLLDLDGFLLRDAHGVARTLEQTEQGSYSLDAARSAVDSGACLAFPDNVELEAVLTYGGQAKGAYVRSVSPTADAVTLVQHHSFIRLPDDGYAPRPFDPRAGSFAVSFADYSAPLDAPLRQRWIVRHRLEKTQPKRARSRVVEPIVFYVDSGTPEPVRSALVEGASWWADAFEAAGLIDAFKVELLPDGAHPLDVRYNVIQWVHRSTRGWSYGGGVIDPRTGEMIKGHVNLGSLRVRQDRLLFEGLIGTEATGSGGAQDPVQVALARIRQLSAHEVGHALGFSHNFAASTYGRASVMDYPAPKIAIRDDGSFDLSGAYGVGIGEWDKQAARYAYSQFAPGADEGAELARIVAEGVEQGMLFLTDADARPLGGANPRAALWDNGDDPVAELAHTLRVRRLALDRFDADRIAAGQPLALLQEVLAPVYFHHRFQLEGTVKLIGGFDHSHAVRGDGQAGIRQVAPEVQRRALAQVLRLLDPAELDLNDRTLDLLLPRPPGHGPNRELFRGVAAPGFDSIAAAESAVSHALAALLEPARARRLVDAHRRDDTTLGLDELLGAIQQAAFGASGAGEGLRRLELRRAVQRRVVDGLIALSLDSRAGGDVAGRAESAIASIGGALGSLEVAALRKPDADGGARAHRLWLASRIRRHLERDAGFRTESRPAAGLPPGSPIGAERGCGFDHDLNGTTGAH
ncbi:hypothetical protein ABI59_00460 [Acidobacteria bacterium Mor1]|nr:hypothetical protein ABI59_00460 [Acidobacteria bacterium Mor1]